MARQRMIQPGIWTDEGFVELSRDARLLWIGLCSLADDEGRGPAGIKTLKAGIFPSDNLSNGEMEAMKAEVAAQMNVEFYAVGHREYYQLTRWQDHQSIQKPRPSTHPAPSPPDSDTVVVPYEYSNHTVALSPKEEKKEKKEEREDARVIETVQTKEKPPHFEWTNAWYRLYAERTTKLIKPSSEMYAAAAKTMTEKGVELPVALETVKLYFDESKDWWFAIDKRTKRRSYSFTGYIRNIEELISALPTTIQERAPPVCPVCGKVLKVKTAAACYGCGFDVDQWDDPEAVEKRQREYKRDCKDSGLTTGDNGDGVPTPARQGVGQPETIAGS